MNHSEKQTAHSDLVRKVDDILPGPKEGCLCIRQQLEDTVQAQGRTTRDQSVQERYSRWQEACACGGPEARSGLLRQGGDLAQVETFWSPQKGPGDCTRPLPSASKAETLAV